MKTAVLFLFALVAYSVFLVPDSNATHNRAGEITYRHIGKDNSLEYNILITTYTKTSSTTADRPTLDTVHLGDGTIARFVRTFLQDLPGDIRHNEYRIDNATHTHIYPGSGTYKIWFTDPNRNADVVNIPNSVNVPFSIYSILVIRDDLIPRNNSPLLTYPPIDSGCVNIPFIHNPVAIDADTSERGIIIHDSLSYHLDTCRGTYADPISGYALPHASNFISIDAVTGDLVWNAPDSVNATRTLEYNVAFIVREWRGGVKIGEVERDMQIRIIDCDNHPPEIITPKDTCVLAGDSIGLNVTAYDIDGRHDLVKLTALGAPFNVSNPATFSTNVPPFTNDTVVGTFSWKTVCGHVRRQPYFVEFRAQDTVPSNTIASMTNLKGFNITVIGPAPTNLSVAPLGRNMILNWSPAVGCSNMIRYNIYRYNGLHPCCQ